MPFTAKDVQSLRQATGAGMMDAKRALEANDGDMEAAKQWLREKGLAKAADRGGRESSQGAIGLALVGNVGAIVQLRCETDFVASSDQFKQLADELAALVAQQGEEAVASRQEAIDDLRIILKENIGVGTVARVEAAAGNVLDSYLHVQGGRGVNGVLVELEGGTVELAHDVAVHIGFAKPKYLDRSQVPAEVVEHERQTLEAITRNEGKPEQALPKIVEGRLNGFFKDICLEEQAYVRDEKVTVADHVKPARIVRFVQVVIG